MKQLEKLLKKTSLYLLSPFFNKKSKESITPNWHEFKRVLVFRLDNRLGNAILVLPLIQSIKRSSSSIKIDVMMSASFVDIYENHPDINQIIPYDQAFLIKNPFRYLGLINKLRKNQYDVIFSSSNANAFSVSQAIFAGILGAGYTVGFDWQDSRKLYSIVVKGNTNIQYGMAQVDLWRYFDVDAQAELPKVYFNPKKSSKLEYKNVLFWLGATKNKILPEFLISKLLDILIEKNIQYQFSAGPADEKLFKDYPDEWYQKTQFLKGSIIDTASFFLNYNMIITPDTGPMHLAVALGIPTVQVFVNSDPIWYGYADPPHYIINKSVKEDEFKKYLDNTLKSN